MALDIIDVPEVLSSAFSPINFDLTTDRNDEQSYTVNGISDNGGFARYELGPHKFQIGDIIDFDGITIDTAYNIRQVVQGVEQQFITTTFEFTTGTASPAGTATRSNLNFKLKAEVYKGDGEHNTIASVVDSGGNARMTMGTTPSNISSGNLVAVSTTTKSFTSITDITDSFGKVAYEIGANTLVPGSIVEVAGVTTDSSYNGIQQVILSFGSVIVTNRDFVSASGGPTAGSVSYQVYDGVHEVIGVIGNDVILDTPFDIDITGLAIKVALKAVKHTLLINDGGTELFRYNVENTVRAMISYDLAELTAGNLLLSPTDPGSITSYTVTYTEQFDDEDGFVKDGSLVQSNVRRKGVNMANQYEDEQNTGRFVTNAFPNTGRFMTDMPDRQKYRAGDFIQLSFLTTEAQVGAVIREKDGGSIINTINIGATDINVDRGIIKIDTSTFLAATDNFTVLIIDVGLSQITEERAFVLDSQCDPRKPHITFLNRVGGYDQILFTGDIKDKVNTRRTEFESALTHDFTRPDRGAGLVGMKAVPEKEAYTHFLNDDEQSWLEQLVTSKHVYIEKDIDGTREYVPIVLTGTRADLYSDSTLKQLRIRYKEQQRNING